MSSATRTTIKGGKNAKGETNKSHKHDKSDTGKGSDKQHGGSENARSKNDDPGIKEKVRQVIDMTRRSEEEVCLALYECDYDAERAINMLYENMVEGEWEKSSKKKKNRQASTSKIETEEAAPVDEWNETPEQPSDKEKQRNKSGGGPPRLHGRHNDNRGWRGRENKENERNLNDANQQDRKERRGRGGHVRGGTGRGRGGGRAGSRYPPRNNRTNFSNARPTIETWDNSIPWESTTITNSSHTNYAGKENFDEFPQTDDWSTEEYTGSLADTKVFTPSMAMPPEIETNIDSNSPNVLPSMTIEAMDPPMVGSLSAAQTQYFNQLTQQSNENVKAAQYSSSHQSQSYDATSQPYNTGQTYANNNTNTSAQYNNAQYGSSPNTNAYNNSNYAVPNSNYVTTPDTQTPPQHHPVRTKAQRARVPPPSKIPSSAVEMPGDINSSITYLDVQFGAMDFMSDASSFDGVVDNKFSPANDTNLTSTMQPPSSNIDLSQSVQNPPLDVYSSKPNTQQSSITTVLSQNITNADSIPQANEHLTATYTTLPRSSTVAANATQTITPTGLDLNKQSEKHSYSQSSSFNSYQPKTTAYQNQNYSSSNYSTPQTTANSYVNSNTPSYNTPSTGNAYQNSYSSVSSYQANNSNSSTFPAISQANNYPANNQYHQQTSQSVYGGNTGLNSNSSYGNTSSGNQYSSYNASSNKLGKESSYDGSTTSVSSTTTAVSSINTSTLTQTTSTGTKSTTALAKNTSNNVMSNIPPAGVTPVMSAQYIMSQVPFFQQPIYSFEDMQLLQQRMPHMTGYYDMSYQTPTTLTAVRDGTLANVAYSISDGRYTRGDNNTSPVPSTLSQQTSTLTQGHQAQPMLAAQTGATPFFYAPYNAIQPTYQFPVYPQLPTVTNAHGSNNSQYPKQAAYGSGYGSGYDPLTQTQDYSKGGYVSNTQSQSKGSGANASTGGSSANDLTAMYGKSHTALGKVNSYDKQGFHSGTPPPFPGALHGNQSTALPSGTNFNPMYISTMPPQQHHSTPLIHQPIHQMEVRQQGRRMDSSSTGQRSQASSQAKSGAKQTYPASYWNQA